MAYLQSEKRGGSRFHNLRDFERSTVQRDERCMVYRIAANSGMKSLTKDMIKKSAENPTPQAHTSTNVGHQIPSSRKMWTSAEQYASKKSSIV